MGSFKVTSELKNRNGPIYNVLNCVMFLRFLRDDDEKQLEELSADERIAVKYYRSLFKEFAVIDLKHYKSGKVCPTHPPPIPSSAYLQSAHSVRASLENRGRGSRGTRAVHLRQYTLRVSYGERASSAQVDHA